MRHSYACHTSTPLVGAGEKDQLIAARTTAPLAFALCFDQDLDNGVEQSCTAFGCDAFLHAFELDPSLCLDSFGYGLDRVFFERRSTCAGSRRKRRYMNLVEVEFFDKVDRRLEFLIRWTV